MTSPYKELLSTKQLTMPVTTDYEVFAERYHAPSEMEARDKKDDMIAKLQASEATLQDELELSRSFNERFREGHELCEVYKGRCAGFEAQNQRLLKENEQLREQATDDDYHIQWVYDQTDSYEDWIRGSDIFTDTECLLTKSNQEVTRLRKKISELTSQNSE